MSHFKKHLSSTEQRLLAEAARMEQDFGAPNPHESHRLAEDFVEQLRQDLERVQRRRDSAALDAARAALQRIGDRGYGVCDACGGTIDAERLHAEPTAKRCGACNKR